MTDAISKWVSGVASAISVAAIAAIFAMWNSLNRIEAEEPLREQLRAFEMEQIRQGLQLNSNELDVQGMKIDEIEDRLRSLERGP